MNKQIKKMKAVMMEYVLIAVLIAAAVVGAVMFFGKSVATGMDQAGSAIVDPTTAQKKQDNYNAKGAQNTAHKTVEAQHGASK